MNSAQASLAKDVKRLEKDSDSKNKGTDVNERGLKSQGL